jgi:hypothetical protein
MSVSGIHQTVFSVAIRNVALATRPTPPPTSIRLECEQVVDQLQLTCETIHESNVWFSQIGKGKVELKSEYF